MVACAMLLLHEQGYTILQSLIFFFLKKLLIFSNLKTKNSDFSRTTWKTIFHRKEGSEIQNGIICWSYIYLFYFIIFFYTYRIWTCTACKLAFKWLIFFFFQFHIILFKLSTIICLYIFFGRGLKKSLFFTKNFMNFLKFSGGP